MRLLYGVCWFVCYLFHGCRVMCVGGVFTVLFLLYYVDEWPIVGIVLRVVLFVMYALLALLLL